MFVMRMEGFIINLVIWYDLILRFRPFFPKMVIFVDNVFYLRKWVDWKMFEGRGLCLFPSLGGRFGFLLKSWDLKISNRNNHKGESCSKLALCLLLLSHAHGWTRIIKKELLVKGGAILAYTFQNFFFLDKRFESFRLFPLKEKCLLSKPWLLSNGPWVNTNSPYLFPSTNSPFNRQLMVSCAGLCLY